MTTLVHTADVHLRPDAQERLDALEAVLEAAADLGADVLTIGGDLFDRPADVETLRGDLRNRCFTDLPFEVVLVPGNHDVDAFRGDLFFGDACTVVADEDHFGTWVAPDGDLRVVCIPYCETAGDELLLALADREPFDGTDVLLFHGSLDAPIGADAGEEDTYRYFPVTEALLVELGFDHYLAGHYHGPHLLQFEGGAEFAYPGTPASTRSSETGRRRVVRLETGEGLAFEPLESFHYLEKRVTVTPGREDAVLEELREWVETAVTPTAHPSIVVDGVVDRAETEFAEELVGIADPDWITNETVSVEHVTAHPVIQEFEARLGETDWDDETKEAVWTRTLRAAGRVGSSRGLE
ncbi:metallophosphoesterase [Natronomonas salina]|uniref:metallophosphoesterase family protein n=1 Tax=Natronomonas salina TaxID=1710540 RepID=UPI0015B465BC|nr:metallophosphoesterase [Natronomonas salina]QLD89031.1 metallophosphoesterase [Natronomonas salina]